jgi:hypothetical protein
MDCEFCGGKGEYWILGNTKILCERCEQLTHFKPEELI